MLLLFFGACGRSHAGPDAATRPFLDLGVRGLVPTGVLGMPPAGPPPETPGCAPTGSCVAQAVTAALRERGGLLARCYLEVLRDAGASARLTLEVGVGPSGAFTGVAVVSSEPGGAAVSVCVASLLAGFHASLPPGCAPDQQVTCSLVLRLPRPPAPAPSPLRRRRR